MDALVISGGIAGGEQPGPAAESIDLDAGIIGQGPATGQRRDGLCLQTGVGEIGVAGLLDLQITGLTRHPQAGGIEHGGDLLDLVGIAAGDHQGGGGTDAGALQRRGQRRRGLSRHRPETPLTGPLCRIT